MPPTAAPQPDGTVERYTHGHHDSVLRSHRWRTVANSASYLLDDLRPGVRVLDVGCGPGTVTWDLAAHVVPGTVVGVDRDAGIAAAAAADGSGGHAARARFAVGDAYRLGFPDAAFDVVHAHQVLQHLADPVAALRELGRVCAPGGVVAARDADYATIGWYPRLTELDRWLAIVSEVTRANGGEPDAGRHLLAWARAAGFARVEASASVWCFATPDERAWWGGLWAERIVASAVGEQAQALGIADAGELGAVAAAWHAWAADPDAWCTVTHGEVRATTAGRPGNLPARARPGECTRTEEA